jgi:hypothetical protein
LFEEMKRPLGDYPSGLWVSGVSLALAVGFVLWLLL